MEEPSGRMSKRPPVSRRWPFGGNIEEMSSTKLKCVRDVEHKRWR